MRLRQSCALALTALLLSAPGADAQALGQRINAVRDGMVRFTFTARSAVCGTNRGSIQIGTSTYISSIVIQSEAMNTACSSGPIQVILRRDAGVTTHLEAVGGSEAPEIADLRDMGTVPAREAAAFLFDLAASGDGRPARDALMPAVLADSFDVYTPLMNLIRNEDRPRELRTSAVSWLGRAGGELGAVPEQRAIDALLTLARDQSVHNALRDQALSSISRMPRASGVAPLIEMVRARTPEALAAKALSTIASSGDPRVRALLREVAQGSQYDESMRSAAARSLGRGYATSDDIRTLRSLYTPQAPAGLRDVILAAVGDFGGRENAAWLLNVAMDPQEESARKRRALQAANRAEAPLADLIAAYDRAGDRTSREELVNIYYSRGDRAAIDKLIDIARSDTDPALRRAAINRLSRSEDPRVVAILREIAGNSK